MKGVSRSTPTSDCDLRGGARFLLNACMRLVGCRPLAFQGQRQATTASEGVGSAEVLACVESTNLSG